MGFAYRQTYTTINRSDMPNIIKKRLFNKSILIKI